MTLHSAEYERHMQSERWRQIRLRILRLANYCCERCNAAVAEEVHHLTYERLGRERDADLQALCKPCHVNADREREMATYRRQEDARLDGWATKKYGEDWQDYQDADRVQEEFDAWLERRSEW